MITLAAGINVLNHDSQYHKHIFEYKSYSVILFSNAPSIVSQYLITL